MSSFSKRRFLIETYTQPGRVGDGNQILSLIWWTSSEYPARFKCLQSEEPLWSLIGSQWCWYNHVTEKARARTTGCPLDGMSLALWMDASECFKCRMALNWTEGHWHQAALSSNPSSTTDPLNHFKHFVGLPPPTPGRVQHSLNSIKTHRCEIAANFTEFKEFGVILWA